MNAQRASAALGSARLVVGRWERFPFPRRTENYQVGVGRVQINALILQMCTSAFKQEARPRRELRNRYGALFGQARRKGSLLILFESAIVSALHPNPRHAE